MVAALARAIHGRYQGFTRPRSTHSQRILYVGDTRWTIVIEDVWEHMAQKRRELQGLGEAIVPHLVEFQANDASGLVKQFYD